MTESKWSEVDRYLSEQLIPEANELAWLLDANTSAGLPAIDVTSHFAKLLALLIRVSGAQRILEIGTLGGFSGVWMARAMPSTGLLVTLESESKHAEVAINNFKRDGVDDRVEIRLGPALDSLAQLIAEKAAPFDFVFVDADKANNPGYLDLVLQLTHPGSVLFFDNMVRGGEVIESESLDENIRGIRETHAMVGKDDRLLATAIQTVGTKGYDGFLLALVVK